MLGASTSCERNELDHVLIGRTFSLALVNTHDFYLFFFYHHDVYRCSYIQGYIIESQENVDLDK